MNVTAPLRRLLRAALATCALAALLAAPAVARAATYDPLNIISCDTWRASNSLSLADIQAFLDAQPGELKSLVTTDYVTPGGTNGYGVKWTPGMPAKRASEIIYDAARYWNVNPKMLLVTLQKEQGLLSYRIGITRISTALNGTAHLWTTADYKYALVRAMGYGVYKGSPNTFPGFGNQVFNAARGYSQFETRWNWVPGMKLTIELQSDHDTTITIVPKTWCTYGLYKYTPYYPQKRFWDYYVSYFGDPLASPRMRPVYRFRNRVNGTYFYTASEAKRYTLLRAAAKWSYGGTAFTVDASATANATPLYEMYNTITRKYYYTTSAAKRTSLLAVRPKQWRYNRTTCYVSLASTNAVPVFKLENKKNHAVVFTSSTSVRKTLTSGRTAAYVYRGVAFYVARSVETSPPVVPAP